VSSTVPRRSPHWKISKSYAVPHARWPRSQRHGGGHFQSAKRRDRSGVPSCRATFSRRTSVPMRVGRGLVDEDCAAPGGAPVVVLTERGWQRHLGSDPSILGRTVRLNHHPPRWLALRQMTLSVRLPRWSTCPTRCSRFCRGRSTYFREPAGRHAWLTISGRLRPGRTATEVQSEIDVLTRHSIVAILDRSRGLS
jgi:hypothetical protein